MTWRSIFTGLCLLAGLALAGTGVQAVGETAATRAAESAGAPSPQVERLPNGLLLILEENHTRPIVAVSLCVNGGSRTETPDLSGLSHYFEHLIYRGGSKEQQVLEFRRKMQQLGDESGGYTSDDYTNYGFTVPKENFDEAFRRATDDWLDLDVMEEKVAIERQVITEEYNQDDDRPDDQVYRRLLGLIYRVHPYSVSPLGLREAIQKANLQTFQTFYRERYVPNQMVLSIVGDFGAAAVRDRVLKTWGERPAGRASFERGLVEPEQREFRFAEKKMATTATKALLGFPVPPAASSDFPACELASALLASGRSSRLWQALKAESNVALSVSAWVERRVDPGFWGFSLEARPESLNGALSAVSRTLVDLAQNPPSLDELNRVRDALLSQRERNLETFFARAEALGQAAILGSPFDVDRTPGALRAVTRDDISRVVRKYLRPERASLSLVSPAEAPSFDPAPWMRAWAGGAGDAEAGGQSAPESPPVRFELANGAVIVVQPRPASGMLAAVALVRGGQWAEPPGREGLAAFTAGLLDRGALGKTQVRIADELSSLGATLETAGEPDDIAVRLQAPGKNQRAALDLLADVLVTPTFPPDEVEKYRQDVLESIRSLPDRPFENTNREFFARLYKTSPYRFPVEGTESSVRSFTAREIQDFHAHNVVGSSLILVVAGPVDAEAIRSWAERRLGALAKGIPVQIPAAKEMLRAASLDTLVARDQEQTTYNTGWPAVSVRDPDYLPLRVAARILRDRVFFKYVYQKGVAYRSWVYLTDRLGPGSIQNEMGVSPSVYREITREVDEDLARFTREPVPPGDLDAAKAKLISRHTLDAETSLGEASGLAFFELAGLGIGEYEKFPERVRAVTAERVAEVAREYLVPGRSLRVGVGKAAGEGR